MPTNLEEKNFQSTWVDVDITIAINTDTSAAIKTYGLTPIGLIFPAAMTGANVTFTVESGGSYIALHGVSMAIQTSKLVPFTDAWEALKLGDNWKVVSDATELAARSLKVRCRAI